MDTHEHRDQTATSAPTIPPIPAGVRPEHWAMIGAKAVGDEWHIPERNGDGEIIGTSRRLSGGDKRFVQGGRRGLTLAWPLDGYAGSTSAEPVLIVEGASDVAAGIGLGLDVVGRPSATGGGEMLAALLKGRHVCIVGENDAGAGRMGAAKIAEHLHGACASVKLIFPPENVKDLRAWVLSGVSAAEVYATAKGSPSWAPTSGPTDDGAPFKPELVNLADVRPEPVAWLWHPRIARGKVTMIVGDPGLGKSFLTCDLAARVSTGAPWPDTPGVWREPAGVVAMNFEDDLADTIRPRLDAAGADVSRINAFTMISGTDPDTGKPTRRVFTLEDMDALMRAIDATPGCELVTIDPLSVCLGGTDSHKNADVRALLFPLGELAASRRVAIVVVGHLNKGGGPAIYRATGSLAFIAAARAAWAVTKDKDDPTHRRRLLLPVKNNLGDDHSGLAFEVTTTPGAGASIAWEPDPVSISADDALSSDDARAGARPRTEVDDAGEWLRDYLRDGPVPVADIERDAKGAGYTMGTLRRAKGAIRARSAKLAFGAGWAWALSDDDRPLPARPARDEGAHDPKVLTEGAHPPEVAHLRAKQAENPGIDAKALNPRG